MFILISAPVYKREWILPYWFEAIEKQGIPFDQIGFQFLTGPGDLFTLHELLSFHNAHPEVRCFDLILDDEDEHREHVEGIRHWPHDRYHVMAKFRNKLLARARGRRPDLFFSLDTDVILEDPSTIKRLIEVTEDNNAVSPLMYMTPDSTDFPNVMSWFDGCGERGFRRPEGYPIGEIFQSDIIMAAVMMSPAVYTQTRYEYHHQGEDVGWSKNATEAGFKLFCAGDIYAPHIMNRKAFAQYLEHGDLRGKPSEI